MSARKKIMLLGEIGVGKTSLIRRLVLDKFEGTYRGTFGFDLYTFTVTGAGPNRDQSQPIVLWDTDGNVGVNIFKHDIFTQGTSAALIVGDLTRPETFAIMLELASGFKAHMPGRHAAFVLNKADIAEEMGAVEIPQKLIDTHLPIIKTSAKTGANVKEAFTDAVTAILRREP